jgi:hypothetical protein
MDPQERLQVRGPDCGVNVGVRGGLIPNANTAKGLCEIVRMVFLRRKCWINDT